MKMTVAAQQTAKGPLGQPMGQGKLQEFCRPRWDGGGGWAVLVLWLLALGLIGGCGGPSQQVLTAQALAQIKPQHPNRDLQQQLMLAANRAALVSYKDYRVGPEDQLEIQILGQDKLGRILRVNGQGEITMPLVGVVQVAGLTPQEIEKRLEELYDARFLVNPQVSVEVKEFRHQRVAVTGAVGKPGPYEIIGPRTLLEVLSMAGGFSNRDSESAGDVINVIRHQNASDLADSLKAGSGASQPYTPKTETLTIDLRRLLSGQVPELNITVHNGDVIHVPFAGTAYVLGGVRKPGNITVKEKLTVSQAVAMAGGVDPILGTNNITVMRFDEQGKPISINTNLNSIISRSDPDLPIKDNDVVVVNESSLKKTLFVIRTLLPIPSGSYSMAAF
jgi:polysaccharide export outer membrane protein